MKLFTCSACHQLLFFENTHCERCGHRLAYVPHAQVLSALEPAPVQSPDAAARAEFVALAPEASGERIRLCQNYEQHDVCNWAVPSDSPEAFCQSCTLNDTIPNLDTTDAKVAWVRLETAKRRLIYSLMELGLPIERRSADGGAGLAFSFKTSTPDEQVFTGHNEGVITINIAEASLLSAKRSGSRWARRTARCWATSATRSATTTGID